LIVIASYVFYGWWDYRFLSLIFFSTVVDFTIANALSFQKSARTRKWLLLTSIAVNLGFLGFFKYYNFFVDNFVSAFSFFGVEFTPYSLRIILPVGISFYTFQTLSYTIDVYRRKLDCTKDFVAFSAFVCFFPQLVAGPIERAANLLPQFQARRTFDYNKAVDGARQILFGLFKKLVIADSSAIYANEIFNNYSEFSGATLFLGAIFFTFQIYGDFSGYSDIAIGTSRLFGFDLQQNFAFPYFSRDISEFWRRWHISLSTWFRDYLYIPLGGSRGGTLVKVRNTFIIFVVSGFWHGANWTFIVWGLLNAIYFLPLLLTKKNRRHLDTVAQGRPFPNIPETFKMLITFGMTVFAWIFFRAESITHAYLYISKMISGSFELSSFIRCYQYLQKVGYPFLLMLIVFLILEWIARDKKHAFESIGSGWKRPFRYALYYSFVAIVIWYSGEEQQFIYFQF
jgi:D-alanyl-lipoteichoic acid acyltransferase DltB (MBOAT superfamily)